jgi:Neuraminidase (sialidase)
MKCSVFQKNEQTTFMREANTADDIHFDCEITYHNSKLAAACWTTTVHTY